MPLFRCLDCETEFEAAKPTCAACGLDPGKDRRHAGHFVELALIHLDPPTPVKGHGHNHAACDPKVRVGMGGHRFTGEAAAVTCPRCKTTALFAGGPAAGTRDIRVGSLEAARKAAADEVARAAGERVAAAGEPRPV